MKRPILQFTFLFCVLFLASFLLVAFQIDGTSMQTTVLYDGALDDTPDTQGFNFLAFGLHATQSFANGVTTLDTMPESEDQAGYFNVEKFALDRSLGYEVQFTIKLQSEAHNSYDRAGFSVLVISEDLLGIELGFWTNKIWAQEGGTDWLFTHAEGVNFDTATDLITYRLAVAGDMYTLTANDSQILSGPLRDYTAFDGVIDPYETPNLLFFGDDSTSSRAKTDITYVALDTVVLVTPTPTPTATYTPIFTPTPIPTATMEPSATPIPPPQPNWTDYWWRRCTSGYPAK